MELRNLEHFVAVAEEGSFTRAAERLHLVQSTLSVSVKSLEKELGGPLFDRSTHHVALTDAGRALLVEARHALAAVEAARDAVAAVHGGLRGTVRVGIMHSLTLIDLAALLTRYHREHPEVQIVPSTAQGGSVELAAQVTDGRLDLAFVSLPGGRPPGLSVHPLATEPLLLACQDDHPFARRSVVPLAELDGERFVDFPAGWGTRLSVDRLFLAEGLRRVIAVEVTDIPTVTELVRAGFGFAFLTASLTRDSPAITLRPVRPTPQFAVSLVTPATRRLSAAARALADLVLSMFDPAAQQVRTRVRPGRETRGGR
ncbi:LysR family transcriptional regulator [Actinacidiphila acididurans]|uniref:LysR family transcriptional regulator n=1 Tax=Actinacidiphila acididurans TaxID=2784346 RepID=A0ABS2TPJ0_9ACTN|nr:LysR family transcriptional regulator [Actinacidiphila acididurans]MBM9505260.1 LysR family transcriptional regulator [Actinacidiphila acididurans]